MLLHETESNNRNRWQNTKTKIFPQSSRPICRRQLARGGGRLADRAALRQEDAPDPEGESPATGNPSPAPPRQGHEDDCHRAKTHHQPEEDCPRQGHLLGQAPAPRLYPETVLAYEKPPNNPPGRWPGRPLSTAVAPRGAGRRGLGPLSPRRVWLDSSSRVIRRFAPALHSATPLPWCRTVLLSRGFN